MAKIEKIKQKQEMSVKIIRENGEIYEAPVLCRIGTQDELNYYRNDGILHAA